MELRNLLVVLPVALTLFLLIGYTSFYGPARTTEKYENDVVIEQTEESPSPVESFDSEPFEGTFIPIKGHSPSGISPYVEEPTCSCPKETLAADCRNTHYPVMGGLDFVQYFTTFKNADGTYDETQVGALGSEEYAYTFGGYTFYFLSVENLQLFSESPESYIPQYGGFCAWGIAGEVCPPYAWDADCMGPSGSHSSWTILEGKLYFFKSSIPKAKFLASPSEYVAIGDSNWSTFFEYPLEQFATLCFSY